MPKFEEITSSKSIKNEDNYSISMPKKKKKNAILLLIAQDIVADNHNMQPIFTTVLEVQVSCASTNLSLKNDFNAAVYRNKRAIQG